MTLRRVSLAALPLALLAAHCSGEPSCAEDLSCADYIVYLDAGFAPGDASTGGTQGNDGGHAGNGAMQGTSGVDASDGGTSESDGEAPPPLCGLTPQSGCTPESTGAIFVDASAGDDGDGSKDNPVNSVNQALQLAVDQQATDIYICEGNYDESVLITDEDVGIDLHGGFDCNDFTYDPAVPVTISPQAGGYALHIDALMSPLLVEDIAFIAVDGVNPGDSSVAVFIAASSNVTFNRVTMTAGLGANGADGQTEPFVEGQEWPLLSALAGQNTTTNTGAGSTGSIQCPAGDATFGGMGGTGDGDAPTGGSAGGPAGRGGSGGVIATCGSGGTGQDGDAGGNGTDGDGAAAGGALTVAHWCSVKARAAIAGSFRSFGPQS